MREAPSAPPRPGPRGFRAAGSACRGRRGGDRARARLPPGHGEAGQEDAQGRQGAPGRQGERLPAAEEAQGKPGEGRATTVASMVFPVVWLLIGGGVLLTVLAGLAVALLATRGRGPTDRGE